jgi:hypothetical protein
MTTAIYVRYSSFIDNDNDNDNTDNDNDNTDNDNDNTDNDNDNTDNDNDNADNNDKIDDNDNDNTDNDNADKTDNDKTDNDKTDNDSTDNDNILILKNVNKEIANRKIIDWLKNNNICINKIDKIKYKKLESIFNRGIPVILIVKVSFKGKRISFYVLYKSNIKLRI